MSDLTVTVEALKDYPALLMKWELKAQAVDIKRAYHIISEALSVAQSPLYVVVDLRENIQMPLKETISGALFGPYNHRNLAAWLVVGGHQIARVVASSLVQLTRQHKVEWFDTEEEAITYMKARLEKLA